MMKNTFSREDAEKLCGWDHAFSAIPIEVIMRLGRRYSPDNIRYPTFEECLEQMAKDEENTKREAKWAELRAMVHPQYDARAWLAHASLVLSEKLDAFIAAGLVKIMDGKLDFKATEQIVAYVFAEYGGYVFWKDVEANVTVNDGHPVCSKGLKSHPHTEPKRGWAEWEKILGKNRLKKDRSSRIIDQPSTRR